MVKSVAFSPEGQRIASVTYPATIRIWDARTGPDMIETDSQKISDGSVPEANRRHWNACCSRMDETNGWVKDEHGKLLLWIPHRYRKNFKKRLHVVIGKDRWSEDLSGIAKPEVDLEVLYRCAGTRWTDIYNPGSQS